MAKYAGGGLKIVTAHSDWFKGNQIPIISEIEIERYDEVGMPFNYMNLMGHFGTTNPFELMKLITHIDASSEVDLFQRINGLSTVEGYPYASAESPVYVDDTFFQIVLENSTGTTKGFAFRNDATYEVGGRYSHCKIVLYPDDEVIAPNSYWTPIFGISGRWGDFGQIETKYITKLALAALRDPDGELWGYYIVNAIYDTSGMYSPDFVVNPGCYIYLQSVYNKTNGFMFNSLPLDPYAQVPWGESEADGGEGTYDFSTDQIDPVDIDSIEFTNFIATQAGFVNLYQPSTAQLQRVAYDLMSGWDQLLHIFGTWDKIIVGLGILPVRPNISGYRTPKVGPLTLSTSLAVVSSQYYKLNCGELEISEIYGSYLDYNPYTKISLYLPYIGVNDIDVDEVMNKTMSILYYVDCYNGNCVANVLVDGSVRYVFSGNCMQEVPVNGESWENVIQAGIQIATAGVGGFVAGAGIAAAEGAIASGAKAAGELAVGDHLQQLGNINKTASAGAGAVMSAKMIPIRSGSIGQSVGMMSPQKPFIIRTIPKISLPENYAHFKGYPSNVYVDSLGSLSGYTEVDSIILNDLAATEPETDEIYQLLMGGIYI